MKIDDLTPELQAHLANLNLRMQRYDNVIAEQRIELKLRQDTIDDLQKYKRALEEHNAECDRLCNDAATCGYRSYFVANGRRCSNCPVDMKITVL